MSLERRSCATKLGLKFVAGGQPRRTNNVVIAGIKEVDQIDLRDASLEQCGCRDMTEDNGRRPAFSRVCNCEEVGKSGITVIGRDLTA